jgi:hypothetical protein
VHTLDLFTFLSGRESSIECNTFEDVDEEDSSEEGELDDLLRWPPEMLLAPRMLGQRRHHENATTATATNEESGSLFREGERKESTRVGWARASWGNEAGAGWATVSLPLQGGLGGPGLEGESGRAGQVVSGLREGGGLESRPGWVGQGGGIARARPGGRWVMVGK